MPKRPAGLPGFSFMLAAQTSTCSTNGTMTDSPFSLRVPFDRTLDRDRPQESLDPMRTQQLRARSRRSHTPKWLSHDSSRTSTSAGRVEADRPIASACACAPSAAIPGYPVSPTIRWQSALRPTPGFPGPFSGSRPAVLLESEGGRVDISISKTPSSLHGATGSSYSAERATAHLAIRSIWPGWPRSSESPNLYHAAGLRAL